MTQRFGNELWVSLKGSHKALLIRVILVLIPFLENQSSGPN